MTEHAKLAPSAAHRWFACPGSVPLSAGVPDRESAYAAEGTFAHEIAARALLTMREADEFVGETDYVHVVDDEFAEHVQVYLDAVRASCREGSTLLVEQRVVVRDLCEEVWGTADALVFSPCGRTLDVFDLKFGRGVWVDVERNPQLLTYALAALKSFPELSRDVEQVRICVVQPRHARGGVSWDEVSQPVLYAWGVNELRPATVAVWEAEELLASGVAPDSAEFSRALSPGDHCQFCPARATCPALEEFVRERTRHLFDDDSLAMPARLPPSPRELAPEQLATALRAIPTIEKWIHALREHAYVEATRGSVPPGFKLVSKVGNRRWIDEDDVALVLEAYDADPFAPRRLVSPAAAERALRAVPPAARKKVLKELAHRPLAGSVLVPEEDKRPPIPAPGSVFGALPLDEVEKRC